MGCCYQSVLREKDVGLLSVLHDAKGARFVGAPFRLSWNRSDRWAVYMIEALTGEHNMAELVRGDGGGFLAGSLVAVLAVFGIFFLTLVF